MPYSTIIYSDDHGNSWKGKINGPKSNTTESQVVEIAPGKLMLNMRDNRGKYRSVSTTTNMGQTWTDHPTTYSALPDPVCMGSLIKTKVNVKSVAKDILFSAIPILHPDAMISPSKPVWISVIAGPRSINCWWMKDSVSDIPALQEWMQRPLEFFMKDPGIYTL